MVALAAVQRANGGLGWHRRDNALVVLDDTERLEARWSAEAEHSHGYIVPVISLFLLYLRSENFDPRKWKGSGWGLPLIGLALVMRLVGERYLILGLHPLSLIPCLAGIFLTLGGLGACSGRGPRSSFCCS